MRSLSMRFWVGLLLLCVLGPAAAQAERHGVRVHYTSIASAGGLEGRAFLPVSGEGIRVETATDPACSVRYVTIRAAVARGPLRAVLLRIPTGKTGRVPLAATGCPTAIVEATLEDGSELKGGRGYVELQSQPSPTDPTFRGTFAQTSERQGTPVTLEGNFAVPAGKVAPIP